MPEQGGGKLIPEGLPKPGQVYTVSRGKTGMLGVYRLKHRFFRAPESLNEPGLDRIVMPEKPRNSL